MTGLVLKVAVFLFIAFVIYTGVRRIWRDFSRQFRAEDKAIHDRDVKERDAPGVITLRRDKDGTFRPPDSGTQ